MMTNKKKILILLLIFLLSFVAGFLIAETKADAADTLQSDRFVVVESCDDFSVILDQYEQVFYLREIYYGRFGITSTITVMYDASGEILTLGRYDIPLKEEEPQTAEKHNKTIPGWYYWFFYKKII